MTFLMLELTLADQVADLLLDPSVMADQLVKIYPPVVAFLVVRACNGRSCDLYS